MGTLGFRMGGDAKSDPGYEPYQTNIEMRRSQERNRENARGEKRK